MKKDNFYKVVIICLLLLNVGMLTFMWVGQRKGPEHGGRHGGPDRIIIERLHLDDAQQKQFEALKEEHHSQMMDIQKTDGELHDQFFELLRQDVVDTNAEHSLLQQIETNNAKRDHVTFDHFKKIRGILKPEQIPLFNDLAADLGRVFGPPPHEGHHDGPPPPPR